MTPKTFRRSLLWLSQLLILLGLLCLSAIAAEAQPLVISDHAVLSTFPPPVEPEPPGKVTRTPRWATILAFAGPLADGATTCYAMAQSGPVVRVAEGNGFYHRLFGGNVTCGKVFGFKVLQSALSGTAVHYAGRQSLERAIGSALIQSAINFGVSAWNLRQARKARRLNRGAP